MFLPSAAMSSNWSLLLDFQTKIIHAFSYSYHVQLANLDLITLVILGEEYKLWSSLCNFLQPSVGSPFVGPNSLLIILFSNTINLFSLNVRDQVSDP